MKTDPRERSNLVDMCYDHISNFAPELSFNVNYLIQAHRATQRLLLGNLE